MSKLIDRNKLLEVMDAHANKLAGMKVDPANHYSIDTLDVIKLSGYEEAIDHVEAAHTIDAEPVRHGKWIHDYNNLYGCSECRTRETMSQRKKKNYCPNCGAHMEVEM